MANIQNLVALVHCVYKRIFSYTIRSSTHHHHIKDTQCTQYIYVCISCAHIVLCDNNFSLRKFSRHHHHHIYIYNFQNEKSQVNNDVCKFCYQGMHSNYTNRTPEANDRFKNTRKCNKTIPQTMYLPYIIYIYLSVPPPPSSRKVL